MTLLSFSSLLALAACGRDVTPSDVKLLNVGNNPNEIGPEPTPYGGLVEYNHVDIAGGALPLGVMGLRGYTEIGPDLSGMAPPFQAVFALSYMFDRQLRGASNLTLVLPQAPAAAGTCYTQVQPAGPFDSGFNTVDVGDWLDFRRADDDTRIVRMNRIPRDYPPESSRLSVFYQALEGFSPSPRTHLVPDGDNADPAAMVAEPYRYANFPFGADVVMKFPGGFTTFDKPVASIPQPSTSVEPTDLTLPQPFGGVQLGWSGPRWTYNTQERAWSAGDGDWNTCFEFTDRTQWDDNPEGPADASECASLTPYPNDQLLYRNYKGQMYTGPWNTEDGVTFNWVPDESDDEIVFAVKFLKDVDPTDDAFVYRAARNADGSFRSAQVCEDGTYEFNEASFGGGDEGGYSVALQGNPSEVLAQVVCKADNNGEFTLTQDMLADAFAYATERNAGGAIFMMGRQTSTAAVIPAVKDQYDQIHEVSPVKVSAKAVKVGRFFWDPSTFGGAQ